MSSDMTTTIELSRRRFLQASGGLLLAVNAAGSVYAQDKKFGADTMPGGTVDDPLVFLSIAADGTVTAWSSSFRCSAPIAKGAWTNEKYG